jgi:hypothetical protein
MSGLIADAKTLIDKARVEAQVNSEFIFFYIIIYLFISYKILESLVQL